MPVPSPQRFHISSYRLSGVYSLFFREPLGYDRAGVSVHLPSPIRAISAPVRLSQGRDASFTLRIGPGRSRIRSLGSAASDPLPVY